MPYDVRNIVLTLAMSSFNYAKYVHAKCTIDIEMSEYTLVIFTYAALPHLSLWFIHLHYILHKYNIFAQKRKEMCRATRKEHYLYQLVLFHDFTLLLSENSWFTSVDPVSRL